MLRGYRYLYSLHKNGRFYADIAKDFGKRFDTSNWELEIALPRGRKEKFIGFMKDE